MFYDVEKDGPSQEVHAAQVQIEVQTTKIIIHGRNCLASDGLPVAMRANFCFFYVCFLRDSDNLSLKLHRSIHQPKDFSDELVFVQRE
ncbi:unnamed protein product [Urochloa humidicola]